MLKTIKEWEEIYEIQILDPDGFDRMDIALHLKEFTKDEFEKGMLFSTIQQKHDIMNSEVIKVYKVHTEDFGWCAFDKISDALYMLGAEIENECYETGLEVTYMRRKTYEELPEFEG